MYAMKKVSKSPVQRRIYKFSEILTLDLDDSPHLELTITGQTQVIQTAHTSDEKLLSIEAFSNSLWEYSHTTREWIPIFIYAGKEEDIPKFVDYVPYKFEEWDTPKENMLWVTPKGFPREQ